MKPIIKICGLSSAESVDAAVKGGASHLGFIFFPKSPRNVSPAQAANLVGVTKHAETVAVTVDADNMLLDEIVEKMNPDLLQLHGRESAERVAEIKNRYQRPVIKALPIREAGDLDNVTYYETAADMLLLDAKPPSDSDLPGGNGISFDWLLVAELKTGIPVLLSGGINISNVNEAMRIVNDEHNSIIGIDVSSGIESAPGVKDVTKIEIFLAACQNPKKARLEQD